jgi:hypothetical protein
MDLSPSLLHSCGFPITRVLPRSVHRRELVLWYDSQKDSPTYREEITVCPGCGEKLPEK